MVSELLSVLLCQFSGTPLMDPQQDSEGAVEIAWRWDRPLRYRLTETYQADLGEPWTISTSQSLSFVLRLDEMRDAGEGITSMRATIEEVQLEYKAPLSESVFRYDSKAQPEVDDDRQFSMAKACAVLVGQSFRLKATPSGEVRGLEGADDILSEIRKKQGPAPGFHQEGYSEEFAVKRLQEKLRRLLALGPEAKTATRTPWSRTYRRKYPLVGVVQFDTTFSLAASPEGTPSGVLLDLRSDLQVVERGTILNPSYPISHQLDQATTKILVAKETGKVEFDSSSGHLLQRRSRVEFEAEFSLAGSGRKVRQSLSSTVAFLLQ